MPRDFSGLVYMEIGKMKKKMCRMLNEALVNRTITGVDFAVVEDDTHGELLVPYLEIDEVWKVAIGFALKDEGDPAAVVSYLEGKYKGSVIERVVLAPLDEGNDRAGLSIVGEDGWLPIWNVDVSGLSGASQFCRSVQKAGIAAPYEIGDFNWDCVSEDADDVEDDEEGEE